MAIYHHLYLDTTHTHTHHQHKLSEKHTIYKTTHFVAAVVKSNGGHVSHARRMRMM